MGAVPQAGDRFQVVIGGGVQTVYNDIMSTAGAWRRGGSADRCGGDQGRRPREGPPRQVRLARLFFEFLSDSFRPILRRPARRLAVHHLHGADEHTGRHPELGRPAHRTVAVVGSSST